MKDGAKAAPAGWQSGRASARPGIPMVRDRVNAPKLPGFERARPAGPAKPPTERADPEAVDPPSLFDLPPRDEGPGGADEPLPCPACRGSAESPEECEHCGGDGTVPAWTVDPAFGVIPPDETPPPTGGGQAPPTEGQQDMANGDGTAVRETDLTTVADLDGEAQQADGAAQSIDATLQGLHGWARRLEDRYAAADFGTKAITDAVMAVAETAPDARALIAFGEALDHLRKAVAEAQNTVGEAVSSQQAEGKAEAFQVA